jgi:HPt (histidine-containing phosphotransfer) domain-containing protein
MDDLDKEAQLLRQLAGIRQSFLHRTRAELPRLRELLGRIQAGDSTGLAPLQIFAHRIRGSGATFDFAAISESAGQLDSLLEVIIAASAASAVEPHNLRCLAECGRRLELEIGSATTQGTAVCR